MKFLSTLLLLILPFSLLAEDSEWFVGVEGGATGAKLNSLGSSGNYAYAPQYGFKAGLRDKSARVYLGFTAADNIGDDITKTQNAYIALEGLSDEFTVIAKSTAKVFIGANFGVSMADVNNNSTTAFMAGVQTGLIFLLPADFEIELAYRHYLTIRDKDTNFNAGTFYGALNYKFYAF